MVSSGLTDIKGFFKGMATGIGITLAIVCCLIYIFDWHTRSMDSLSFFADLKETMKWAYDNLRLSLIPFILIFFFYIFHLNKLKKLLKQDTASLVAVNQLDHLVDIWINIFFGIGVIWTAIGMRSALIKGLGGLDYTTAASQGAFFILERLVNGGILIALSTTIFGGVGGYLMRLFKAVHVGYGLKSYYSNLNDIENNRIIRILESIDQRLASMTFT